MWSGGLSPREASLPCASPPGAPDCYDPAMADPRPAFVYLLRPHRPDMLETMTPEEDRVVGEHFHYLKRRFQEGSLVLAGPCVDAAFGLVIFHAADEEEARGVMARDPAVVAGVMTAELHAFRIALHAGPQ